MTAQSKILRGPVVPGVAPPAKSKIISGMLREFGSSIKQADMILSQYATGMLPKDKVLI